MHERRRNRYAYLMPLKFAWDARKASANLRKHGVSFSQAASAFADLHSITIPDPDHSAEEDRLRLIGCTRRRGRSWSFAHVERGATYRVSSALDPPAVGNGECMKKVAKAKRPVARGKMRAEYDFSGGVRGSMRRGLQKEPNLVLLAPEWRRCSQRRRR